MRATLSAALAVASGLLLLGTAVASPPQVQLLGAISKMPALPHTRSCMDPHDGPPTTDVEPTIAVNPRNPLNLIAGWWTGQAGFKRLAVAGGYAVTYDGGRAWRTGIPQRVDSCSGRPAYSVAGAHDEWVTFAPDGRRAYLLVESGRHLAPPGSHLIEAGNTNTIWIYASNDGGSTWGRPVNIANASLAAGGPDQPRLAIDPRHENHLYVVWRQIPPSALKTGDIGGAPAYLARSSDMGRTWSTPREIFTPPRGGIPEGPYLQHPFVNPDGTLVDVFDETSFFDIVGIERPAQVIAIRSSDRGRTWSTPVTIATHTPLPFFHNPDNNHTLVIGTGASAASGPNGTLYVTWGDRSGHQRLLRMLFSQSRDGGRTWSAPRPVGHSTTAIIGATIAVAGDGHIGVMYYDTRHDRVGDNNWTTDVFLASSTDGGTHWHDLRLAGPFNLATAPPEGNTAGARRFRFLGDYFGLAGLPHGFAVTFTMAKPKARQGRTDIFFARVNQP